MIRLFSFFILIFVANSEYTCAPRYLGFGSIVCTCNSTFCGSIKELGNPQTGKFHWYVSDKSGKRLELSIGKLNDVGKLEKPTRLYLTRCKHYQKVHGWDGSFTDSALINIDLLSPKSQYKLMESYFGREGSRYNLARVPIAGSDFSTRGYTYDDVESDVELKYFSLQREDKKFKIPAMRAALLINPKLKFVATAWTAPPWMKSMKEYGGFGFLKVEYYQTYADYLIKFLDEYKKRGITFWSISTGNEPTLIPEIPLTLSSMSWTAKTMMKWIAENLRPSLVHSQHKETEIYTFDDQRTFLPHHVQLMFENKEVEKYVKTIGIHWYSDADSSPKLLDRTHALFPDKTLLVTEACTGFLPYDVPKVKLGSWERAEDYILRMIENINHWVSGWIDWNLVLNRNGGPNWINNFVDAPIIVNPKTDEFFKQPLYYAMTHFSRFVPRDSVRLHVTEASSIAATAFQTTDKNIVIVLCHSGEDPRNVSITDSLGQNIAMTLRPRSLNTVIYKSSS